MFRLVKKIDLDNEKVKESYEKHHEKIDYKTNRQERSFGKVDVER